MFLASAVKAEAAYLLTPGWALIHGGSKAAIDLREYVFNCMIHLPLISYGLLLNSEGSEIVNALALFLLLLLDLFLIVRQQRLKHREVERRLWNIINRITGEAAAPQAAFKILHTCVCLPCLQGLGVVIKDRHELAYKRKFVMNFSWFVVQEALFESEEPPWIFTNFDAVCGGSQNKEVFSSSWKTTIAVNRKHGLNGFQTFKPNN